MTQERATPDGFWKLVEQAAERVFNRNIRPGLLNSASISSGGLTIKGGFLRMLSAVTGGTNTFYVGPINPALADGSYQPGVIISRNDGTTALLLWDPIPSVGDYNQFLAWYDRAGNIILSDDTDAGQGIARPYLSGGFAASRFTDFRYSVTGATFVTVAHTYLSKQQPRMRVRVQASMDTAATTGELRVLVDGVQLGSTTAEAFVISTRDFGALAFAGSHMQTVHVEIQGRVTSGSGTLKIEPIRWETVQS